MTRSKAVISPVRLASVPAYVAFIMLAIGAISFVDNKLFTTLIGSLDLTLPLSSLYVELAIVPAMLALASLRQWGDRTLKAVMYLSLALYLPAVIGVSRIDLLRVMGYSHNFTAFSCGLSPAVIALFGILLACGGLSLQSFSYSKRARTDFLKRGADPDEVDHVLYRHTLLEAKITGAAAAVVIAFIISLSVLEPAILWVLQSLKFFYVLASLGATLILALVVLHYLKSVKR